MRQLRLRTSLTLLLVLTVGLLFSLVGGAILMVRLPQVEARSRAVLQDRAAGVSRLLEHYSRAVEAQMASFSLAVARRSGAGLQTLAADLVRGGELFDAVYVLTPQDRVEVLGLPAHDGPAVDAMLGLDLGNAGLVKSLRALESGDARVLWSDAYLSVLAGRNTVALGRRVGERILIFEMAAERLLDMLKDASPEAGYNIFVIDHSGRYLASSFLKDPAARFVDYSRSPSFRAAMEGRPLPPFEVLPDGRRMLVGAVRSEQLGWLIGAVTEGGWGEYSYRTTIVLVAGGLLFSLLMAAAIAPIWAGRLARPLDAIIARTHRVREGDHSSPWPHDSGVQELNQLVYDIEQMVDTVQAREHELQRNTERLRATLETTPSVAVQWYDSQGRVLYWNPASEAMYGYSALQAVGCSIRETPLMYLDQAQAESVIEVLAGIAHSGQAFGPAEFQLRRADGRLITVLATIFAIPSDDAGAIYVCMDIDVTERKTAAQALLHSEQQLEAIFNASPAPLSVSDIDADFRISSVNAAWERLFKRKADEVRGRNGGEIGLWHRRADRDAVLHQIQSAGALEAMEVELCDGAGRVLLCRVSAVIAAIDGQRMLVMAAEDVTEQHRAEAEIKALNAELEQRVTRRTEELSRANDELERNLADLHRTQQQLVQSEKLAALGQLVAGVAHELNTPVGNGMMAMSTLRDLLRQFRVAMSGGLRRSALDDFVQAVEQGSDIALRNLARAGELVASFKQVAIDQTTMQRRHFKLAEIVDENLLTLNPMIRRTPYRVERAVPDELELDSYPGPLGQVLSNLINNAIVHGFDGRDHGLIRIVAEDGGDMVRLRVADDGVGIPPEQIGRVFDPFFTTRMGRGGTGLGLHIVHNLVRQVLGGHIEVHSRPGAGSEFRLELPKKAPPPRPPRPGAG